MRIYIDFDDVLCETARHLSAMARELFSRNVPYEAISVFNLQESFSLSDAEISRLMEHAHASGFLTHLAPAPGCIEALQTLEAEGHELTIVTGRPASSHAGSCGWLRKHGLEHLRLIYLDKYGRASGAAQAGAPRELSRLEFDRLPFDVAIDDAPTALDLLAHRRNCTVIVYDRPWNRRYRVTPAMRRFGSWPEILRFIGEHRISPAELLSC